MKFNLLNAIVSHNMSVFKNIMFEVLMKIDQLGLNADDLKNYLLNKTLANLNKIDDKEKLAFIFIQISTRFCKVIKQINIIKLFCVIGFA